MSIFQLAPSSTTKAFGGSIPTGGFFMPGCFIDVVSGAFEFLLRKSVFEQSVVLAIHLHRAQGDDFAATGVDDADVFALKDAGKDRAQSLTGLR